MRTRSFVKKKSDLGKSQKKSHFKSYQLTFFKKKNRSQKLFCFQVKSEIFGDKKNRKKDR
ncbi:hypothetical protein BpHYR1_039086 [Brachionus plicatilis]|uniref:Uncharacterized protein n=1 Tax=Brachionus plicatilis TaxID=10195 RepID=A0A3M7RZ81_BRAPC|nr:hypothetical protein BpHYR1_039086 [Brachionus plicatilis]